MGTMSAVVKSPRLSEEAISRFIDPRTGERLRPLGVVGGRTIWPMMGASPDDPADGGNEGDPNDGSDPEGGDGGEGGSGSDKGDPQAKITALEEEKQRQYKRRQEAEKERDDLKKRLDELEGKDKSETEKLTTRVTELERENEELTGALRQTRLDNAFLTDNSYEWHNPRRALSLADLSEVEIDDDGTVHGLKKALDALAKSDAYLLKKKEEGEEEEPPATSGSTGASTRQKKKTNAEQDTLRQKYPALNR